MYVKGFFFTKKTEIYYKIIAEQTFFYPREDDAGSLRVVTKESR